MVAQNHVVSEMAEKDGKSSLPKSEDILTANLIQHSVQKIWNDYDHSKDGRLSYEESKVFISDSFGGNLTLKDSELK